MSDIIIWLNILIDNAYEYGDSDNIRIYEELLKQEYMEV